MGLVMKEKNYVIALSLINDMAIDYDGCRTVEALKGLVDELRGYALEGLSGVDMEEKYSYHVGHDDTPESMYEATAKEYGITSPKEKRLMKRAIRDLRSMSGLCSRAMSQYTPLGGTFTSSELNGFYCRAKRIGQEVVQFMWFKDGEELPHDYESTLKVYMERIRG